MIKNLFYKHILIVSIIVLAGCQSRTPNFHSSNAYFNSPITLDSGLISETEDVILSNGSINVTWIKWRDTFFASSLDEGKTWKKNIVPGAKQNIASNWPYCFKSDANKNFYIVQATTEDGVIFIKSEDQGNTWQDAIQISEEKRNPRFRNPAFCRDDSGKLFVIYRKRKALEEINPWKKERYETDGLYIQHSLDGGLSWSKAHLLPHGAGGPIWKPFLTHYKNTIYLVFANSIYKSLDQGRTWKEILEIPFYPGLKINLRINLNNGDLNVVWAKQVKTNQILGSNTTEGYVDICFLKSKNGGRSWTRPSRINDKKLKFSWTLAPPFLSGPEMMGYLRQETKRARIHDVSMSPNGNIIGIVWTDWRDGIATNYFSYSLDQGQSWSTNTKISESSNQASSCSFAISNSGELFFLLNTITEFGNDPAKPILDNILYFMSGEILGV